MLAQAGTWKELSAELRTPLTPATLQFLEEGLGFPTSAPVQRIAIPLLLQNQDVVVEAATGSGKTLSYLVPSFEMCLKPASKKVIAKDKCAIVSLVLLPTRELCKQVSDLAIQYTKSVNDFARQGGAAAAQKNNQGSGSSFRLRVCSMVGGKGDLQSDIKRFQAQGGNILIATPGRLYDGLLHSSAFRFNSLELLVMDEADRLMEMGFRAQLDTILDKLPRQRRTGLFSATQTRDVQSLAKTGLRNARQVRVSTDVSRGEGQGKVKGKAEEGEEREEGEEMEADGSGDEEEAQRDLPTTLTNEFVTLPAQWKLQHLIWEIKTHLADPWAANPKQSPPKAIVFFLTCASVDYYAGLLRVLTNKEEFAKRKQEAESGHPHRGMVGEMGPIYKMLRDKVRLFPLHGKLKQSTRNRQFAEFKECKQPSVLLCTDLGSRGLDIPAVDQVIQFDCPQQPDTFIHRVGRTARMGRSGRSVVFLMPNEADYVQLMTHKGVTLTERRSEVLEEARKAEGGKGEESDSDSEDEGEEMPTTEDKPAEEDLDMGSDEDESGTSSKGKKDQVYSRRLRMISNLVGNKEGPAECISAAVYHARLMSLGDRELLDMAVKAFVSFIQAYKKHDCQYIFKIGEVDLVDLMHGHSLLKVPSMPELRKRFSGSLKFNVPDVCSDVEAVRYLSDTKQDRHDKKQAVKAEKKEAERKMSDKKRLAAKLEKMSERNRKRTEIAEDTKIGRRRKRTLMQAMETQDLCDQYRHLKKRKLNKISREDMEAFDPDL